MNDGFGLAGTDFVLTAHITEDLVYQGEINFQAARGEKSEIEVDTERFFVDYSISELVLQNP